VPSITASPNPATAGQDVLVAGSGFPGGTPVDVIVQSDPVLLGTVVADAAGAFRASFRIPADTPPGNHRLVAQARVGGVQADVVVVVVAPAVVTTTIRPTTGQTLSRTGANVEGPARLAGALVGIGFGLVGLTWRSKRTRRPLRV
jgi:hypothetical protein